MTAFLNGMTVIECLTYSFSRLGLMGENMSIILVN